MTNGMGARAKPVTCSERSGDCYTGDINTSKKFSSKQRLSSRIRAITTFLLSGTSVNEEPV